MTEYISDLIKLSADSLPPNYPQCKNIIWGYNREYTEDQECKHVHLININKINKENIESVFPLLCDDLLNLVHEYLHTYELHIDCSEWDLDHDVRIALEKYKEKSTIEHNVKYIIGLAEYDINNLISKPEIIKKFNLTINYNSWGSLIYSN
jgi:hypothetical protein